MENRLKRNRPTGLIRSKAHVDLRDPNIENKESPDPVISEDDDDSPIIWQMTVHGGPIPFFSHNEKTTDSKPTKLTKPTILDKLRNLFNK